MTGARAESDYDPAEQEDGYINATSTCDCVFRTGFAGDVPSDVEKWLGRRCGFHRYAA